MTRAATGTATRPCPIAHPAGLYLIKAGTLYPQLILMGLWLSLVLSSLLYAFPAHAQSGYPGGRNGVASTPGDDPSSPVPPYTVP